jgi:enamine deaminase RidA (YjgF/YER057c/UK114 family)
MNVKCNTKVFAPKGSGAELQIMVCAPSVESALRTAAESIPQGFSVIAGRLFLDEVTAVPPLERPFEAISVVRERPLGDHPVSLWIWTSAPSLASGLLVWSANLVSDKEDVYDQTYEILRNYQQFLTSQGLNISDNCIRTWFFVDDIDHKYADFVRARREFFDTVGLRSDTHYIASTGIFGVPGNRPATGGDVMLDAFALRDPEKCAIRYLNAYSHLSPTSLYGVTFERGTVVEYDDRNHIFISGTASIDSHGKVVHAANVGKQCDRMMENVSVLLSEADATMKDVQMAIVYLRNSEDLDIVQQRLSYILRNIPHTYLLAPVCRPEWLVEIECMAVTSL